MILCRRNICYQATTMASHSAPCNSPPSSPEVTDNDWQVVNHRRSSQTSPSKPESPAEAELHLHLDSEDEFPSLGSPTPWTSRHTSPRSSRSSSSLNDDPFSTKVDAAVKER